MGTIYDENGRRYEVNSDYLLPCLMIGNTYKSEIGMWGQRHKRYLKSHHRVFYYNLLTSYYAILISCYRINDLQIAKSNFLKEDLGAYAENGNMGY